MTFEHVDMFPSHLATHPTKYSPLLRYWDKYTDLHNHGRLEIKVGESF